LKIRRKKGDKKEVGVKKGGSPKSLWKNGFKDKAIIN